MLTVAAIERVRPQQVTSTPIPTFSFGSESRPTPTASTPPSSTPSPTGASAAAQAPAAEQRFLSAGSGGMWRATAGVCGGPAPVVERSVDGGRTWTNVTPTYKGIAQVISLSTFAGTEAEMVAAMGANCEVQALRTFTQGEFWDSYPDVLAASTYVAPADASAVVTPDGPKPAPCTDPRSVRAIGDAVALVCDGTARISVGADWRDLGPATTVALTADAVLIASTGAGCDGATLTRVSLAGGNPQPAGCATGASDNIAIASDGTSIWVWSDDTVTRIRA
ncbi:hypothetical protein ACIQLJ_13650 [Microbacterium sp. NPDC091313]